MRTLFLIRHAKSSWNLEGLDDIDRHLNHRGYKDAHEMAMRLKKHIHDPYIISSPAVRAYSTALIFARHLHYDPSHIHIKTKLYGSGPHEYRDVIASLPDERHTVMLFGHNPVITEVLNAMADVTMEEIPTCGAAGIDLGEMTWKRAASSHGKLLIYDFPKNSIHD